MCPSRADPRALPTRACREIDHGGGAPCQSRPGNHGPVRLGEDRSALRFALTFTLITLPLVIVTGLGIALAVNNAAKALRGPIIFVSLLPFIITPMMGALNIRWLFVGDGILTSLLEQWLERDIAMFAQAWTIELLMLF